MSSTPGAPSAQTRRLIHRTALGASLVLALSGVAMAPSQAATAAPAASAAPCLAPSVDAAGNAAVFAGTGRRATTQRPDDGMEVSRSTAAAVQRQLDARAGGRSAQTLPNNSTAIPVVAHIIRGKKKRAGHITRAGINDQLAAMNVAYSGGEGPGFDTPFRFFLKKVTKTRNQSWYHLRSSKVGNAMKRKLHRGKANTLNLYFVKFGGGLLGYSTFPFDAHGKKLKLDGTVIDYRSRPGGELVGFNQGDTGVHEVGHWLGLFHTFQGGTSGCGADPANSGDYVADTPSEATPTSGCPVGKDSCPGDGLLDPVNNFMDYGSDQCMTQFTQGQVDRMSLAWQTFR